MNCIEIPKEKLEKLHALHESVKGTPDYTRYAMETCVQKESGDSKRWFFVGWYIPNLNEPAKYRKQGLNVYLYQGKYRYTVSSSANAFNVLIGK